MKETNQASGKTLHLTSGPHKNGHFLPYSSLAEFIEEDTVREQPSKQTLFSAELTGVFSPAEVAALQTLIRLAANAAE